MKTGIVKISHLVEIPELKAYYTPQSIDEIATSIEVDGGMRSPIIVTENYEIIDGYRRVDAMKVLNKEYINVLIDDVPPTTFERIIRNMYRTKTVDDQVKELKSVFERYPKKMGQKNKEGRVYNRTDEISKALNKKYSGKETISKLEHILSNDIENNLFTKGIIEKNWKMETSHEFLTKWYKEDIENNFGFTNRLKSGEINVQDAVKLVKQKLFLENEYQDTFVIPEKATSYNIDCLELGNMEKHSNEVDLLFTSPPYFILRKYQSNESNQVGHEETKEDYCINKVQADFNEITALLPKEVKLQDGLDLAKFFAIQNIYFDLDKSEINDKAEKQIAILLYVMQQNPTIKLEIKAHTDSRASDSYNLELSNKRALATQNWLVKNGIDPTRIISKGYGESMLVNKCANGVKCSEKEHQMNRRSEFIVISN